MGNGLLRRVSEWLAAALVAGSITTGTVLIGPESIDAQEIRVAAFNIQVFGKTKRSNPEVMGVLAEIAQQFDIVVVQEIRDATQQTAGIYLEAINETSEYIYSMHEGPRVGRTSSKEQYVIYYIQSLIELVEVYTISDENDLFEREPLVATFRSGRFDFTLVVCHIKPDDAEAELIALETIAAQLLEEHPSEQDIILLGDFNADGRYLDEGKLDGIFGPDSYAVVITDEMDTMTKTDNAYDRIIITQGAFGHEYILDSAAVFEFDWVLGIDDEDLVFDVSDHYPVYAQFSIVLVDDD